MTEHLVPRSSEWLVVAYSGAVPTADHSCDMHSHVFTPVDIPLCTPIGMSHLSCTHVGGTWGNGMEA